MHVRLAPKATVSREWVIRRKAFIRLTVMAAHPGRRLKVVVGPPGLEPGSNRHERLDSDEPENLKQLFLGGSST
jgi:hypothetical protein